MARGVKNFHPSLARRLYVLSAVALAVAAAGCSPKPEASQDPDAYMRSKGYARAPQILSVTGSGGVATVSGQAVPEGRVRFLYGGQRAIGVTADSKGRFKADLPLSGQGGLFDVAVEDTGRLVQAEGRLFIPPEAPQKAVLMRSGSSSLPVAPQGQGIAFVDYDAAGAMMITGVAKPGAAISAVVDGESWPKQAQAATDGSFTAVTQIPPPGDTVAAVNVTVQAGGQSFQRAVPVSHPTAGDSVTPVDGGWRVDWAVPGGGMQTTIVF